MNRLVKFFLSLTKKQKKWRKQKTQLESAIRTCKCCFKEIKKDSIHNSFFSENILCYECFSKLKPINKLIKVNLVKGLILFEYNDFLKEQLFKLKGCGDIELSKIFLDYRLPLLFPLTRRHILIPAPSSKSDDEERGFNHVVEIYKPLKLEIKQIIKKRWEFKQSDCSKNEREMIKNKLEIIDGKQIKNKRIILVDDVFTTGSTMRAMIDLVKPYKPKSIKLLLICSPTVGQSNN